MLFGTIPQFEHQIDEIKSWYKDGAEFMDYDRRMLINLYKEIKRRHNREIDNYRTAIAGVKKFVPSPKIVEVEVAGLLESINELDEKIAEIDARLAELEK